MPLIQFIFPFFMSLAITIGAWECNSDQEYLIENKISHAFSNPLEKDNFHVGIKGSSIVEGIAVFTITSATGQEYYHIEFPARYLIGYELVMDKEATDEKEAEVIVRRINEFFDSLNFITPAIDPDEDFDTDYSDEAIWYDIKSDSTAIGFHYKVGEEDLRFIAYSKTLMKVVIYYNCC